VGAEGETSFVANYFDFPKQLSRAGEAIGITANFINHHSAEEEALQERSVAFQFNQQLFQELHQVCGLRLENLVYFRGVTHYFVVTARRDSLLECQVFHNDHKDLTELVHPANINTEVLEEVMRKLAKHSGLPQDTLAYATNHSLANDVQLFDFSTKHQCEVSAKVVTPSVLASNASEGGDGPGLLVCLAGDALVAPFWPQGTGGNRAVLSALDTAWMVKELKVQCLTDMREGANDNDNDNDNKTDNNKEEDMQMLLKERHEAFRLMLTSGPETLVSSSAAHFDPTKRYKHGGISFM